MNVKFESVGGLIMLGFFTNDNIPGYITLAVLCGWFVIQYLKKDNKISQNDIANIKENLTNHVTGTEKKIEKLTDSLNQLSKDINKEMNQLKDNMSAKIDSNFSNLITILYSSNNHQKKEKEYSDVSK